MHDISWLLFNPLKVMVSVDVGGGKNACIHVCCICSLALGINNGQQA